MKLKRLLSGTKRIPFDKGVGFCVMKKHRYEGKLIQLIESEQFERHDIMNYSVVQKNEKNLNNKLLAMNKRDEITDSL